MKRIHSGAIILFHNAGIGTPEAIDNLFAILKKESYQILPISQILIPGSYYTDHTGK